MSILHCCSRWSWPQELAPRERVRRGRFQSRVVALVLVPPILEPDFHLCLAEVQRASQLGPLTARKILLGLEHGLQAHNLVAGENGASLLLAIETLFLLLVVMVLLLLLVLLLLFLLLLLLLLLLVLLLLLLLTVGGDPGLLSALIGSR